LIEKKWRHEHDRHGDVDALDFTSSLYLGFEHPSAALAPWHALTLGKPAVLEEFDDARDAARSLAALAGCGAGCLLPSTFHLFWDLLGCLSRHAPIEIVMDAASYPILRWCAEHWALRHSSGQAVRGVPLRRFAVCDADALERVLGQRRGRRRPLVLCDGFLPGRDVQPPLARYAALAAAHGGWLVIDDTQAFGIRGESPSAERPYGHGGGGSLRWHGIRDDHVIVGASLAKGFGVPVALLAGGRESIARFERDSETREHSSPPSMAVVRAAQHALVLNRRVGDARRARLVSQLRRWRVRLAGAGLRAQGGSFPVQSLQLPAGIEAAAVHAALKRKGIDAVLSRAHGNGSGARLSFLFTANHSAVAIEQAARTLIDLLASRLRTAAIASGAAP
jgi:8-amino-7-oxononanoate synthase